MMGMSLAAPTYAFETPGDKQVSERFGFDFSSFINSDNYVIDVPVYHIGNTAV